MNERTFVLKGTICYSNSLTELSITENGYLVCEDGRCRCLMSFLRNLQESHVQILAMS